MQKLGVAYDGSEQSKRALQRCLAVASRERGDVLHIITAIG